MAKCEVRNEYPYDLSTVVMESCVNKKLDETHRDISEHDIENNLNAPKTVMGKYPYCHNDGERKTEKTKKCEIHRLIYENVTENHQDTLDKVTIEISDGTTPADM